MSTYAHPQGFTLVEMMIVAIMVGALAALAGPRLTEARQQAATARAASDIRALEKDLYSREIASGGFPVSLSEIQREGLLDPWGNPYRYTRIKDPNNPDAKPRGARKDRFLVPINSDFDLYSMGPDGATNAPLTSASGADDIVRANNGRYVGVAADY